MKAIVDELFKSEKEAAELVEAQRLYVPESARGFFLAALSRKLNRKIVFIPSSGALLEDYLYEIITFFDEKVFEFPDFESLPHEKARVFSPGQVKRIEFLKNFLKSKEPGPGLIHPLALLRRFPPAEFYRPTEILLRRGDEYPFESLVENLIRMGYEKVEVCEGEGTFAVRGGLIDVFPAGNAYPVRIEFFGDEVEDLREFDQVSQVSISRVEAVTIGWNTDTPLVQKDLPPEVSVEFELFKQEKLSLASFWPFLFERLDDLPSLLKKDEALFVFENLDRLEKDLKSFYDQVKGAIEAGFAPSKKVEDYFLDPDEILAFLYETDHLEIGRPEGTSTAQLFEEVEKRATHDRVLFYDYLKKVNKAIVIVGSDFSPERVLNSVKRVGSKANFSFELINGYLRGGFLLKKEKTIVLPAFFFTGGQVMMKAKKAVRIRGEQILDLSPGDLVVHPKYGIGRYAGLERDVYEGILKEYLVIQYKDGKIKLPLEQADIITQYIGEDEEKVELDRLGSNEWKKARQKAQRSAKKLAFDLLKVYAKRKVIKRRVYDISNPWIYEFESLFPYEETLDQAAAINDVYLDLSSEYPMERLIIGDVGYGKTEVAMRAAFVAVVNNRQVIVMAPTTVLAEQHFKTWTERFQHFPINIGFISRFQSSKKRKEIIDDFNLGKIDILIGTHAVLSRQLSLDGVGLVIIDEEHRFGVNQKEYFKARKPDVDLLYLSATPIPRTLQLALSGLKPISLIETPPPGRLPVVTHIGEYDELLILSALRKELERGGQALYVCNDIPRLPLIAEYIAQKIEGARVAYAHGQLPEKQLEKTMLDFWEGKYDILVSTTIIESGLDMPNVNTIIVEGVEKLGLAQAYQLKGRVGRSYRQAYAYFLTRKSLLTEKEEKRLKALLELTGWGSGYRLALRDLEIRGAGNLLGPEQHGHMMRVGIGYFLELLKEEVEKLKAGIKERKFRDLTVDLPIDIHIPDDYINSLRIKFEIYRRAAQLGSYEEMKEFMKELEDRFGSPPKTVRNLLEYGLMRNLARQAGVIYIKYTDGVLTFRGDIPAKVLIEKVAALKKAKGMLNQISVELKRDEILRFLSEVFAAIITKIKFEGSH
jgi:transcription-repair coupling factor (superfamily II helicase)